MTALYSAIIQGIHNVDLEGLLDTFRNFPMESNHNWGQGIFVSGLGLNVDIDDLLAEMVSGQIKICSVIDFHKKVVEGIEEPQHD